MLPLIKDIDDYLLSQRLKKDRASHYPSQLSIRNASGKIEGKCNRASWYSWTNTAETNPIPMPTMWKFEMANLIHTFVGDSLKGAGYRIESEVSFKIDVEGLKYPISGRLDNIFIKEIRRFGIEIKTRYGKGFTSFKSTGPRTSDLIQVLAYLKSGCIDEAILLVINYDSGYREQFSAELTEGNGIMLNKACFDYADITWDNILLRLTDLENHIKANVCPVRDFEEKEWQCKYCQYKDKCWIVDKTITGGLK